MGGDYKRNLVYRDGGRGTRRLVASFDSLLDALTFVDGTYDAAPAQIIDVENIDEGDMTMIARGMRAAA